MIMMRGSRNQHLTIGCRYHPERGGIGAGHPLCKQYSAHSWLLSLASTTSRLLLAMFPVLPLAFLWLLLQSGKDESCRSLEQQPFFLGGRHLSNLPPACAACCSCRCAMCDLGRGIWEGLAGAGARRQVTAAPYCESCSGCSLQPIDALVGSSMSVRQRARAPDRLQA